MDETYLRVAGRWTSLWRAIDSARNTTDLLLSPKRDLNGAKHFLCSAILQAGERQPRVINVDGHAAHPVAIESLKKAGDLRRRCRYRRSRYMNNVIEQDHRFIKRRVAASQWFRSLEAARSTIAGDEAMNIIFRKDKSAGYRSPT